MSETKRSIEMRGQYTSDEFDLAVAMVWHVNAIRLVVFWSLAAGAYYEGTLYGPES